MCKTSSLDGTSTFAVLSSINLPFTKPNLDLETPLWGCSNDLTQESSTCCNKNLARREREIGINFPASSDQIHRISNKKKNPEDWGAGFQFYHLLVNYQINYLTQFLMTESDKCWNFNGKSGEIECMGQELFAIIYTIAFWSGITECRNNECSRRKNAFKAAAPSCKWEGLREFISTCLGCKVAIGEWRFILDIILPTAEQEFRRPVPKYFCIDIRGMLDLYTWSEHITEGDLHDRIPPLQSRLNFRYGLDIWRTTLPEYESEALNISRQLRGKGICPNRLYNVPFENYHTSVGVCRLANTLLAVHENDLPNREDYQNPEKHHRDCTPQFCQRARDNSTLISQAHKCLDKSCQPDLEFPTNLLDEAGKDKNEWFNTAWYLQKSHKKPCVMKSEKERYMAISHVWSDGTGVGLKTSGRVNRCLYEYFQKIAEDEGCDGLWWDTISIPVERVARGIAIQRMLVNFEKAHVTLIHDENLVKFPWREDGSPAIALILSAWFTRGWTAAELFASRNHSVKVLFANPDSRDGDPLIKDLDKDVFAANTRPNFQNPAGTIPMQGYIVAAEAMKRIRDPSKKTKWFTNRHEILPDLLNVLSHRTTSWVKDRMLIAGLMCPRFESASDDLHLLPSSNMTGLEITRIILQTVENFKMADILHSDDPTATYGPWSWCPRSIFQFGHLYRSSVPSKDTVMVSHGGYLSGDFKAFEVLEDDRIVPCGSHPASRARVSAALFNREKCLLLSVDSIKSQGLYILAQPVYVDMRIMHCRWVHCVWFQSSMYPEHPQEIESDDVLGIDEERRRLRPPYSSTHCKISFGQDVTFFKTPLPPSSYKVVERATNNIPTYRPTGGGQV